MKSLKQLVVLAIFSALACAGLQAQSVDMRAIIPFDFRAGNTLMPAGEYEIHGQGPWIIVRLADGGRPSVGVMTNSVVAADPRREARLEFNRYGNAYFLSAIWSPFSGDGRQLPASSQEKQLAKRGVAPAGNSVVLARNN
jgi:hypothetical protein